MSMRVAAARSGREALEYVRLGLADDAYQHAVAAFRAAACCLPPISAEEFTGLAEDAGYDVGAVELVGGSAPAVRIYAERDALKLGSDIMAQAVCALANDGHATLEDVYRTAANVAVMMRAAFRYADDTGDYVYWPSLMARKEEQQ
jgi:hypothetical protein